MAITGHVGSEGTSKARAPVGALQTADLQVGLRTGWWNINAESNRAPENPTGPVPGRILYLDHSLRGPGADMPAAPRGPRG